MALSRSTHVARSGWLLVGLIVVISAVILALVGITFYLTEHLRTTSLRQNQTRAIYLAQAGVMRELYDYRRGQEISLGEQTVTAGPLPGTADDDVFNLSGPDADFLLVNMRSNVDFENSLYCPSSGPGRVSRQRIRQWSVRNVLASGESSLTVVEMRINWSPYPPADNEGILRIDLNGTSATWTDGCTAAARNSDIDIPDRTLTPGQRWGNNQIWFTVTSGMDAKDWIDVTFILSDGTERTSRYYPSPNEDQSWAEFTLRSVGEVRRGAFPFSVWRRLRVEYRVCAQSGDIGTDCNDVGEEQQNEGAIVAYEELNSQTP